MAKYEMSLDLNVLNHLGLNLYSNTPAVLSEVVANSYDADALNVKIYISKEEDKIKIIDDGNGMTLKEINDKFLKVGYQKRINGEAHSKKYNRAVMGRKGIGKLSLLSIADTIEIHSKTENEEGNALLLSKVDLEQTIVDQKADLYHPKEIDFIDFDEKHGTKIIITDFQRSINRSSSFLRPRLAKRFVINHGKNPFNIFINDRIITIEDRSFFKKVEFLWPIGNFDENTIQGFNNIKKQPILNSNIENTQFKISGWIATVDKPSSLKTDGDNNNKISIICRGKLAQEDILTFYNEGGMYADYIIGEIHADFLDDDNERDIATSNRQQFNENDVRFQALQNHVYSLLKKIQGKWTSLRNEVSVKKATSEIPVLSEWYDSQRGDAKKYAKKLFATIENLHFDEDLSKKKEIYKFGVLAFERLRIADKLSELENLSADSLTHFGEIFSELQDIEATLYYDIAKQRVDIINKISDCCNDNEREKVIQQYLFDNLWLLDTSWDRATVNTGRLEQSVKKEFKKYSDSLSDDEKKARIDIRYKTSAGKHIIIELKRYKTTYKIDEFDLGRQVKKYTKALKKCLLDAGEENPYIEAVCVVGPGAIDDLKEANETLKTIPARVITYDELIKNAQDSYKEYLEQNVKAGKIKKLIEQLN
jgi:hypothetical protein